MLALFNENKAIPPQASGQIQCWALTLASYEYSIVCNGTSQHVNANAMSCLKLPLSDTPGEAPLSGELVLMVERLQTVPISATQILPSGPTVIPVCCKCYSTYVPVGWLGQTTYILQPFWTRHWKLKKGSGIMQFLHHSLCIMV